MNHEMEQRVRDLLEARVLDQDAVLPGMEVIPTLIRCDGAAQMLEMSYETKHWMKNPMGVVHGGVVGILMDNAMGTASYGACGVLTPTITMTLNFLRPVPLYTTVAIRARVVSSGKSMAYLDAELFLPDQPDRVLATATGVYSTKGASQPKA